MVPESIFLENYFLSPICSSFLWRFLHENSKTYWDRKKSNGNNSLVIKTAHAFSFTHGQIFIHTWSNLLLTYFPFGLNSHDYNIIGYLELPRNVRHPVSTKKLIAVYVLWLILSIVYDSTWKEALHWQLYPSTHFVEETSE